MQRPNVEQDAGQTPVPPKKTKRRCCKFHITENKSGHFTLEKNTLRCVWPDTILERGKTGTCDRRHGILRRLEATAVKKFPKAEQERVHVSGGPARSRKLGAARGAGGSPGPSHQVVRGLGGAQLGPAQVRSAQKLGDGPLGLEVHLDAVLAHRRLPHLQGAGPGGVSEAGFGGRGLPSHRVPPWAPPLCRVPGPPCFQPGPGAGSPAGGGG